MKLKLLKPLLLALLSAFAVIPSLAELPVIEETLTQNMIDQGNFSRVDLNQEYVFTLGESLSFDGSGDTPMTPVFEGKTITFHGNGNDFSMTNFTLNDNPWANAGIQLSGDLIMSNMGNISFDSLSSTRSGAIYSSQGSIRFLNTGSLDFIGNVAETREGGAIYAVNIFFENVRGKITFKGNQSLSDQNRGFGGGAIIIWGGIFVMQDVQDVLFENNYTQGTHAGAIVVTNNNFILQRAGNVDFIGNYSKGYGGALFASSQAGYTLLSADNGNITFKGNLTESLYNVGLIANAAILEGKNAYFRAQTGREICFYDGIYTEKGVIMNLGYTPAFEGDTGNPDAYEGTVRFSGFEYSQKYNEHITLLQKGTNGRSDEFKEDFGETDEQFNQRLEESRRSHCRGAMNLLGGSVMIEYQAIVGDLPNTLIGEEPEVPGEGNIDVGIEIPDWGDIGIVTQSFLSANVLREELTWASDSVSQFIFTKGLLEITTGGVLTSKEVSFSGRDAVIGGDGTGRIVANAVDMSKGFSFDVVDSRIGIVIEANSITYGGTLGVADRSLDTYADNKWATTQKFTFIDISRVGSTEGSFTGIVSNTTGSNTIDSAYGHQGSWSYEWVGNTLVGTWTPLGGGITDVDPELEGNIVSNSMWSSASNAKALSNTALVNANILRFESSMKSNFWVKGIGDFAYDDSTTELDGYSYQGGGYAAGADFKLGKKSIVGVAFGQLMGDNKSELYTSQIKQDSMMGSLYAAHLQTLNKRNSLLWTLAGTYGDTENSMNTHYSDGDNSSGSWNNNAYFVEAKMEWRIAPEGKSWTYKPFIGVEYTEVKLEGFTEVGDKAREFAEGAYKNIALPIGIGFEHQSHFGKKTWLNSLSLAYVPDVYREAPNTQATRLSNGFSWKDQGSKPSIHTLRATINSTLQLNASWTAYAGYTFEAREDASYHNVNTGVSYSF